MNFCSKIAPIKRKWTLSQLQGQVIKTAQKTRLGKFGALVGYLRRTALYFIQVSRCCLMQCLSTIRSQFMSKLSKQLHHCYFLHYVKWFGDPPRQQCIHIRWKASLGLGKLYYVNVTICHQVKIANIITDRIGHQFFCLSFFSLNFLALFILFTYY